MINYDNLINFFSFHFFVRIVKSHDFEMLNKMQEEILNAILLHISADYSSPEI